MQEFKQCISCASFLLFRHGGANIALLTGFRHICAISHLYDTLLLHALVPIPSGLDGAMQIREQYPLTGEVRRYKRRDLRKGGMQNFINVMPVPNSSCAQAQNCQPYLDVMPVCLPSSHISLFTFVAFMFSAHSTSHGLLGWQLSAAHSMMLTLFLLQDCIEALLKCFQTAQYASRWNGTNH